MLSSDCIYIYIYWRGGNKLKAFLTMGFARWKMGSLGRAESGWQGDTGEEEMPKSPFGWKKILFGWKKSRKRSRKRIPPHPCGPRGDLGVQEAFWAQRVGDGAEAMQAQVSPKEGQKPSQVVPEVPGAGSGTWRCLLSIWDGIFVQLRFFSPQRGAEASRPGREGEKAAHVQMRFSLFPSWDRLENFTLLHGKPLGKKKKKRN